MGVVEVARHVLVRLLGFAQQPICPLWRHGVVSQPVRLQPRLHNLVHCLLVLGASLLLAARRLGLRHRSCICVHVLGELLLLLLRSCSARLLCPPSFCVGCVRSLGFGIPVCTRQHLVVRHLRLCALLLRSKDAACAVLEHVVHVRLAPLACLNVAAHRDMLALRHICRPYPAVTDVVLLPRPAMPRRALHHLRPPLAPHLAVRTRRTLPCILSQHGLTALARRRQPT
mmetsp:Transcript_48998/g.98187  ORF Transcript_48998/g.98187 Transcript_48998/m.98187 type:complete len:228 (-) Transcript_48998:261-944(-)